jgi:hypothetical protein
MVQLRIAPACFKTEVDKHGWIGFIFQRGGNFQAAVPDLSSCDLAQRRHPGRTASPFASRIHPETRPPLRFERLYLYFDDLGRFRRDYVKEALEDEVGERSALDHEVIDSSLQQHEILAANTGKEFEKDLTFGERLSDRIADFGGSWTFIMSFGVVLVVWIIINTVVLATRAFDPRTGRKIATGPGGE